MQEQFTENKNCILTKFVSALGGISDAIMNVGVLQAQENSVRREWESKRFETESQNAKSLLDFEREKFIASQTLEREKIDNEEKRLKREQDWQLEFERICEENNLKLFQEIRMLLRDITTKNQISE